MSESIRKKRTPGYGYCVASAVCCCLFFIPICPVLAIIFGHVGLVKVTEAEESGVVPDGKGMAMVAQIVGYLTIFCYVTLTLVVLAGCGLWWIFAG